MTFPVGPLSSASAQKLFHSRIKGDQFLASVARKIAVSFARGIRSRAIAVPPKGTSNVSGNAVRFRRIRGPISAAGGTSLDIESIARLI